jgi:hypothetical protein
MCCSAAQKSSWILNMLDDLTSYDRVESPVQEERLSIAHEDISITESFYPPDPVN